MTIVLSTQYPGKADTPSAGYPQGSFKNVSAPGAGDGTPWEKVWVNDWAGFFQRLVNEAGITPSGSPDTIVAGDNWDALESLFQRGIPHVDSGTANAHVLASALGGDISAYYDGFMAQYPVNLLNTAAVTANVNAIGAKAVELPGGVALAGGELSAGQNITIRYNLSDDKFYIIDGIPELTLSMEDGITITNNTVDPNRDIDFSTGSVCDSSKNALLKLPSILVKQLDAVWAVGTNAGGLFTGSIAADTWYNCFVIQKDSDGSVDAGFDTSEIAANRPSGYTKYRLRGAILTDSSSNIIAFFQFGDEFRFAESILDEDNATLSTSQVNYTISVPPRDVQAILTGFAAETSAPCTAYIQDKSETDYAPLADIITAGKPGQIAGRSSGGTDTSGGSNTLIVRTDDSQVAARASSALTRFKILTHGWIDPRGK